ncbi:hypothetical protein BD324DRAFT_134540 [Kockovaella imperatae]|uniref:Uncharacterized protein n=1 Tax=Kockovaella imperatae TaxID=4999 RepID=A0A1Y1U9U4_9TREE|nr:hypothetical protein BD324DRAFT_134540 [Kockovaella imperatae]ORX34798.1 hypothetical protein BD324DRAFT_134540 [Kockovaella imperatae]
MDEPGRPSTPDSQQRHGDHAYMGSPSQAHSLNTGTAFLSNSVSNQQPSSPARYAATSNAFGLATSPSSSMSPREFKLNLGSSDRSPPSAGTIAARRLRRPSLLGLAKANSLSELRSESDRKNDPVSPTTILSNPIQDSSSSDAPAEASSISPIAPLPQNPSASPWSNAPFLASIRARSSASPLSIENLTTRTPAPGRDMDPRGSTRSSSSSSLLDVDSADVEDNRSPLRWIPSHLQHNSARRRGKSRMEISEPGSPPLARAMDNQAFQGRPLPATLLATLISESSPLEHEMRSEARLQRLIASHPRAMPFTPRPSRSSRGRFPETADDDDDDDAMGFGAHPWRLSSFAGRRVSSSDSDSDDMPMEDTGPEPVNAAFAAGMDMDRPGSSSSSASAFAVSGSFASRSASGSGPGTNNQPTPPGSNAPWAKSTRMSVSSSGNGMVPSPGVPTGLPFAFGSLGVGGSTPQASPTVERIELVGSPSAVSVPSPSLLQYRESQGGSASVRPGKRKVNVEDRFDPYKRPRATSPALTTSVTGFPMSPSRSSNPIPIPHSPSHAPFQPSSLSTPGGNFSLSNRQGRPTHPYTRPMSSRSRAASPALSIGSTSGILSTSLGERSGGMLAGRPSLSLGQAFIPTGSGAPLTSETAASQGLGSLGLLSLANERRTSGDDGAMEVVREDSEGSEGTQEAMEED